MSIARVEEIKHTENHWIGTQDGKIKGKSKENVMCREREKIRSYQVKKYV